MMSQSLFQQMVFCNKGGDKNEQPIGASQSLFQQMVFCNNMYVTTSTPLGVVTILILVDGFLQYEIKTIYRQVCTCHNPYFSRWFSAILIMLFCLALKQLSQSLFQQMVFCNMDNNFSCPLSSKVTILILVDGFLQ